MDLTLSARSANQMQVMTSPGRITSLISTSFLFHMLSASFAARLNKRYVGGVLSEVFLMRTCSDDLKAPMRLRSTYLLSHPERSPYDAMVYIQFCTAYQNGKSASYCTSSRESKQESQSQDQECAGELSLFHSRGASGDCGLPHDADARAESESAQ